MRLEHWQAMLLASDPHMLRRYNRLHDKHAERLCLARDVGADEELLDNLTQAEFRAFWDLNARKSLHRAVNEAIADALRPLGAVVSLQLGENRVGVEEVGFSRHIESSALRCHVQFALSADADKSFASFENIKIRCVDPRSGVPLTVVISDVKTEQSVRQHVIVDLDFFFIAGDLEPAAASDAHDFAEFHNALRILNSLDLHEINQADVPLSMDAWDAFRKHPFREFIRMPREDAVKIWGAIEARQRRERHAKNI